MLVVVVMSPFVEVVLGRVERPIVVDAFDEAVPASRPLRSAGSSRDAEEESQGTLHLAWTKSVDLLE